MRYPITLLLTLMITPNNITPSTSNSETLLPKNLIESFDLYGFTSPEQKEALAQLFNFASISGQEKPEHIIIDILNMVKATQEKFTIRKGTQERWEICARSWMVQNQAKILSCLTELGFVKSIAPKKKKVDAICILGGTAEFMLGGVVYTEQLLKTGLQAPTIILLSGERYLTKNIDGTQQELEKVAEQLQLSSWQQLTEMHLLQHLFDIHANLAKKLTVYAINTPAGKLPRPTTQTTLLELFAWLEKHPEIQSLLFISHQPCTWYQKAIIDSMFSTHGTKPITAHIVTHTTACTACATGQQISYEYEVVGDAREAATVQLTLEGLGGYLWAATPKVLTQITAGLENPDRETLEQNQELKKLCRDLYAHNPLLYQALPIVLK